MSEPGVVRTVNIQTSDAVQKKKKKKKKKYVMDPDMQSLQGRAICLDGQGLISPFQKD